MDAKGCPSKTPANSIQACTYKAKELEHGTHSLMHSNQQRFYPMSTLFNLPEACLYADLVDHLGNQQHLELIASKSNTTGQLSFLSLFQDVRTAMDHVHLGGMLKNKTLENLPKYVKLSCSSYPFG